ncbi:DDE superfamily endonuclease [Phytophthora infestans]|uniref:DDE superfamily endonuclease n=1 Tax=Phytophthora infestans TaxID=4787 RepID=A0A8S9V376_PHYIN|nr:DDE superfamily endonuclease [Phytophthora infestans]
MDVDDGFLNVQHAAVNARAAQYAIHDRHGFAGGEDVEMGVPGDGSAGEADGDADDDVIVSIFLLFITHGAAFGTLDWRSLRAPPSEQIVVRSDFYAKLKEQRSLWAYRKTLRCMPASFDALCSFLGPLYYRKYGLPGKNLHYSFDWGLAVLLTYYGNGCGQDGDGIGGAAAQLGMSRPVASRYIKRLEKLLYGMMDDVIYFPSPTADDEWGALVDGFAGKNSDFPDVACVFDGTLIRTRRPNDHQGFYDKSGKPSYNCLAAIDFRYKFRYIGVFSGSNSDQSMWNQSVVLGARARDICPPGVNWLGDAGFKLWPFLMVLLTSAVASASRKDSGGMIFNFFNYHLSQTRIIVERVFGKLKARFKVLHGVTDRRKHETNARMICSAAVLHNILIDIGDKQFKGVRDIEARKQAKNDSRQVMTAYNQNWDRTQGEVDLAIRKRNMYADRFYERDNEHK